MQIWLDYIFFDCVIWACTKFHLECLLGRSEIKWLQGAPIVTRLVLLRYNINSFSHYNGIKVSKKKKKKPSKTM